MGWRQRMSRPSWPMISAHFPVVRQRRVSTAAAVMAADQSEAYLRDRLDGLGIEVTDERDLYVVLAVVTLNMEMADGAHAAGALSCEERAGIYRLGVAVTTALIDYVPGDVR